jgi:uncharacterized protein (TIGR02246 family)
VQPLFRTLVCVAALAAPLPASFAAQTPASGQPQTVVTVAVNAWVAAFNSRDPKRIVALYAPDAVLWGTTAKTIATTPESIWAYFKDSGQRPTVVTINSLHERFYGDIAIADGAYTFSDPRESITTNDRPARYTFVFRRVGGRWLIVDHHSSRVPQP